MKLDEENVMNAQKDRHLIDLPLWDYRGNMRPDNTTTLWRLGL
jgi:hypothetical protein